MQACDPLDTDAVPAWTGDGLTTFNFTSQAHWTTLGFSFGPWGSSYFNGYMANVGLWRRPIDDSEVSCLYKCKSDRFSLHWRVCFLANEEGVAQTARPTSGSLHCNCCDTNVHYIVVPLAISISESRALAAPDTARKAGERHKR